MGKRLVDIEFVGGSGPYPISASVFGNSVLFEMIAIQYEKGVLDDDDLTRLVRKATGQATIQVRGVMDGPAG